MLLPLCSSFILHPWLGNEWGNRNQSQLAAGLARGDRMSAGCALENVIPSGPICLVFSLEPSISEETRSYFIARVACETQAHHGSRCSALLEEKGEAWTQL